MPVGVIKTKADHKKWKKAKKIVEEQHGEIRWPLVMHIYQQMAKDDEPKDKNVLIERALDKQGRKVVIPQEVHDVLKPMWERDKDKLLTPEQKQKLESIKQAKQRRSEFKIVKSAEELNYVESSLKKIKQELDVFFILEKDEKSGSGGWKPPSGFDPKTHPDTSALMLIHGLNPREASFMSGAHTSNEYSRGRYFRPTPLSEGMLEHAKRVAKQKFEEHEQKRRETADPAQNPDLFLQHNAQSVHKGFNGNFQDDLKNFKESDEFKNLSQSDRPGRIMQWKADWQKQNLENQKQSAAKAAGLHSELADHANTERAKKLIEQRENILRGGEGVSDSSFSDKVKRDTPDHSVDEDLSDEDMEDIKNLEEDDYGR